MILVNVQWEIYLVYLDDVIVLSGSPKEHLQHLDEVLTLLGKAVVTLNASKCYFFQEEVKYLGHVIRPGRVNVLEKNLLAVGETPSPLMTRSPRYEPGEGPRAHTQCP